MIWTILELIFDSSNLTLTTFILVFTVCVLVQRLFLARSNPSSGRFPPSPGCRLPFIGHLHLLGADLREPFRRFRHQLGDVYSLQFGNRACVVITGYQAIREALVKNGDVFINRPILPVLERISRGAGLVNSNDEKWKENRRFTMTTLKDFGMGKSVLETKIHEEVEILSAAIEAENELPFNPKQLISTNVANVICSMIFGSTFKHGDEKFKALIDAFQENIKSSISGLANFLPFLEYVPGDLFMVKTMIKNSDNIFKYIHDIIEEHQETFDENDVNDYISAYLKHLNFLNKSGSSTTFSLPELEATVGDLFIAGAETTTTTLMWAFPLLATHPDIQNKLYEEIETTVGTQRLPALQDKTNLVNVEAFYMEVLRYTNLTVIGLPRATTCDIDFRGYVIPKDTMIFMDMDSVQTDPGIWTDPENFRPSRFIDESGRLRKIDEFVAFSLGKRNCAGESLARMELLLFLSAIIQKFEILCPDGEDLSMERIDGIFGAVHAPKSYNIVFRRRLLR